MRKIYLLMVAFALIMSACNSNKVKIRGEVQGLAGTVKLLAEMPGQQGMVVLAEQNVTDANEASKKKSEKFEMTMDEVRKKYGNQAIGYASVVKNDMGIGFSADREDDGEE